MQIFTISTFRYPKHIEETFHQYTFYYDHNNIYQEFFQQHYIADISYNEILTITNATVKKLCFAFYVLYVKGGFFIDLNVIPTKEIETFHCEPNHFYCVKSILNNNTLFNGIFGSHKENKSLLILIQSLIDLHKQNGDLNNVTLYNMICNKISNTIFLKEEVVMPSCVSTLTPSNIRLFDHYYDHKMSYTIPFAIAPITQKSDIKIGVTLLLFNDIKSFFSNGINQNSLFLGELLLNCGFDVYFIVEDTKLFTISPTGLTQLLYDPRFKLAKYSDILYNEFNLIITLSFSYGDMFIYNYLKHMNTKHVGYFCGNTYIIESEKILYNQHKVRQNDAYDFMINGLTKYDQIWSIPQMSELNLDFWSILYKCKCIEVPFVWSTNAIRLSCIVNNCTEEELRYQNRGVDKKVAIFEPNISIMKWALPSILICESVYRTNKHIKHLYVTNINSSSTNDFNVSQFNKLLKTLDIVKENKCSIESRYNTLMFMSKYADIVISHQWGNPLNYLYFDLAWMGWPIIHNAYLCKDVGYYYENYQLNDGGKMLEKVISSHDSTVDTYINVNRKAIDVFLPTNKVLQQKYIDLVMNLFI